ncbi:hypothetical protein BOBR111200_06920 [Bordetella bronchialis]
MGCRYRFEEPGLPGPIEAQASAEEMHQHFTIVEEPDMPWYGLDKDRYPVSIIECEGRRYHSNAARFIERVTVESE